ncbi:MAG: flippase-like domain-containing protein [Bacilli bacterium]|nr:flippase-like domain-containing protein [Bacilli bacterium]
MKKIKKNSIIILILTLVLLFFMLRHDYKNIAYWLVNCNKLYLILAIVVYFISVIIDSTSFYMIIKQYSNSYKFKDTLSLNIMTKFFNGVTPLSSGGQPLQVYELYKNNINLNDATNIVVQFFIIYQIAMVIFSTVAVILNRVFKIFVKNLFIRKLVILGYVINVIVLLILFLVSLNRKFNIKVITFIIKVLSKLKIIKNKDKLISKWELKCENFYNSAQILKKNWTVLIKGTIIQMIQLLFLYSVPLLISMAIYDSVNMDLLNSLVASSYVYLIGSYIIVPGATGGIEYGFMKLFSNFLKKKSLMSATILWRFITYYLPVILGAITFNIAKRKNGMEDFEE